MQDQLKTIRKACISANPSILDLVFGCVCLCTSPGDSDEYPQTFRVGGEIPETKNGAQITKDIQFSWAGDLWCIDETIGRKIGLSDVLLAIRNPKGTLKKLGKYYELRDKLLHIEDSNESDPYYHLIVNWNLSMDDITHQSPECISFLANLLGNEAGK